MESKPESLIPVMSQILNTEPQRLARDIYCFTIFYVYFEIGLLQYNINEVCNLTPQDALATQEK